MEHTEKALKVSAIAPDLLVLPTQQVYSLQGPIIQYANTMPLLMLPG
ncbi:hypothetical protein [Pontibacter harenae]|nr:hypothetical protein [Pontibacter harenae]MCC9166854.1 hypothetical protein [Pontibacter harenae]